MGDKIEKDTTVTVMGREGFPETLTFTQVNVAERYGKVKDVMKKDEILFTGTRLAESGAPVEEDKVYAVRID